MREEGTDSHGGVRRLGMTRVFRHCEAPAGPRQSAFYVQAGGTRRYGAVNSRRIIRLSSSISSVRSVSTSALYTSPCA